MCFSGNVIMVHLYPVENMQLRTYILVETILITFKICGIALILN